jgi:hypothetical protein
MYGCQKDRGKWEDQNLTWTQGIAQTVREQRLGDGALEDRAD